MTRFHATQQELQTAIVAKRQLEDQKMENENVLQELQQLESDAVVFREVGAVLLKQEKIEAVENVEKRLQYIQAELARASSAVSTCEDRMKEVAAAVQQPSA